MIQNICSNFDGIIRHNLSIIWGSIVEILVSVQNSLAVFILAHRNKKSVVLS